MTWAKLTVLVVLAALMTGGSFTCKGSSNDGRTRYEVTNP